MNVSSSRTASGQSARIHFERDGNGFRISGETGESIESVMEVEPVGTLSVLQFSTRLLAPPSLDQRQVRLQPVVLQDHRRVSPLQLSALLFHGFTRNNLGVKKQQDHRAQVRV